jgi:hypothetical protein
VGIAYSRIDASFDDLLWSIQSARQMRYKYISTNPAVAFVSRRGKAKRYTYYLRLLVSLVQLHPNLPNDMTYQLWENGLVQGEATYQSRDLYSPTTLANVLVNLR